MNDIEILEGIIETYKRWNELPYKFNKDIIQALENILKERQEDKERIKELEKSDKSKEESSMNYYNQTKALQEDLDKAWEEWNNLNEYHEQGVKKYQKRIKELERQCDIYEKDAIHFKKLYQLVRGDDMIEKSLVREKIEELDNLKSEYSQKVIKSPTGLITDVVKIALLELLEERN